MYKNQSDKLDKFGMQEKQHKSLFEMEPEQARALLDDLDVYVKKDKAIKQAKDFAERTKRIKNPAERKRVLSSTPEENSKKEDIGQVLKDKYAKLEEAFMAREDNLLEVRFMQDEIRRIKEENELEQGNLEIWSTEFIYMLMIQEKLGFEEIQSIKNPTDMGLSTDDWLSMKGQAETDQFKVQIMQFKGIEVETEEVEEIIADEEQDFEPVQDREEALRNFDQRNRESREGYAEDTRQAEEITFSDEPSEYDEAGEYDEASEYYREPTSQEEGLNEENDYEY